MAASVANRETATPRDFHQAAAKFGKVEEKQLVAAFPWPSLKCEG